MEILHQKCRTNQKTILELNGLFIKVGQLLSIMSTILPDAYSRVLESLQDAAPQSPYPETEKPFNKQLGKSIEELFTHFEKTPIASASIGQVHKAQLKTTMGGG